MRKALVLFYVGLALLGTASRARAEGALSTAIPLDLGFRQMYNLQFEQAHRTFKDWEELHPDDPLGPASDAAAYLFSEFDRLGVLQWELFLDDEKFKESKKLAPDPVTKRAFDASVTLSEKVADRVLARSPDDRNALLAKVMALGLRSDYLALIEKRYLASVRAMKSAGLLAQHLLAIDPTCYDANLAIGVENYVLGLKPAPLRWALRMYGAETDKDQGIQKLRLTAQKGHYLLPFAQLLLAVAALRDKDKSQARELLAGLARQFPNNALYRRELERLH